MEVGTCLSGEYVQGFQLPGLLATESLRLLPFLLLLLQKKREERKKEEPFTGLWLIISFPFYLLLLFGLEDQGEDGKDMDAPGHE